MTYDPTVTGDAAAAGRLQGAAEGRRSHKLNLSNIIKLALLFITDEHNPEGKLHFKEIQRF